MFSRCSGALKRRNPYINRLLTNVNSDYNTPHLVAPPTSVRVVICGGGMMGASVAYHLGKLGWGNETVLIEQNRVGGGTTWHSSGLIGVFKPSLSQVKLTKSSIDLYKELESKGLSTGWKQCGSLNIARTRDRMAVFQE
ncbi:hypothetical protein NQ317_019726 [Molorchus minor]|uniref:FAD dependent oxidoreductase domain-containing protein n=1 Tax=Molorchus minor TaxID=1323400 RepID=A0ABQ9JPW5_9CUCU|nr:hypothetical protein NQ317_019726 [Molorchus minor]